MQLIQRHFSLWQIRAAKLRSLLDLQFYSIEKSLLDGQKKSSLFHKAADRQIQILDFGAGRSPYGHLFTQEMDALDPNFEAAYQGWKDLPPEKKYDLILCIEVLEHLSDPITEFFEPSKQKLQRDGELWLSVPYSARIHPCPEDWHRWTPDGFCRYLENAGFEILEFVYRGPAPFTLWSKINWLCFRSILGIGPNSPDWNWQRIPQFFCGLFLLPIAVTGSLVTRFTCEVLKTEDEDPLGFFVRAKQK